MGSMQDLQQVNERLLQAVETLKRRAIAAETQAEAFAQTLGQLERDGAITHEVALRIYREKKEKIEAEVSA